MSSSAKVLIKLYDIELEGIWGRGDQIYPGLWLTNDREGFESLLTSILANGAGVLEFSQFISPCVVIYSKLEKTEVESPRDAIALLSSYLYLIQGFLDALCVIKDHAVNFELGFLEAQRDGEPPFINSNLIGD